MTHTPDEHDPIPPARHDSPRPAAPHHSPGAAARPSSAAVPPSDAAAPPSSHAATPSGAVQSPPGGAARPSGDAPGAGAGSGGGRVRAGDPSPATLDELALRRLLHDAVREVRPRDDALDRLGREIPARRARRRQALVGIAAGVLLVGTAMPAVLHVTQPDSSDTAGTINASSGLTPGGTSATYHGSPLPGSAPGAAGQTPAPGAATPRGTASPQASAPGAVAAPTPGGGTSLTGTPACVRTQLGQGTASTDAPDSDGRVYGTFRVVNVSSHSCAVTGPSEIAVTAQGDTDLSQIQVVDHTEGDPAGGLPSPAEEPAAVILPPGEAYQVEFAWIPASGGGPTGCSADATPPPTEDSGGSTGDDGATDSTTDGSDNGTTGSATTDDSAGGQSADAAAMTDDDSGGTTGGPPGDGESASPSPGGGDGDGIALANVPPEGGPAAASTDISGACAGTVYQTDPMPTP